MRSPTSSWPGRRDHDRGARRLRAPVDPRAVPVRDRPPSGGERPGAPARRAATMRPRRERRRTRLARPDRLAAVDDDERRADDGRARSRMGQARRRRTRSPGVVRRGMAAMSGYRPPPGSIPTLGVPSSRTSGPCTSSASAGPACGTWPGCSSRAASGVTGSDLKDSEGLLELRALGADGRHRARPGANLGDPMRSWSRARSARTTPSSSPPAPRDPGVGEGSRRSPPRRPTAEPSPSRARTARPRPPR